jgi:hypothetical protein
MKNCSIITSLAIVALVLFGSSMAWAQSSGNFVATVDNTVCSINTTNGALIPPPPSSGNLLFTGPGGGSMKAIIKLPNSSPGLLVTPSLVTGMYTSSGNFLSGGSGISQTAGIVVVVTDTLGSNTVTLTPNQTCVDTSPAGATTCTPTSTDPNCKCGVVYDERFQQLCAGCGFFSFSFDKLVLSTMAAHSFNFTEGNVPGGIHTVKVNWYFGCDSGGTGTLHTNGPNGCMSTFTPNTAAACAGPGTLTVQQVQNFEHDSQIQTTGP